MNETSTRPGKKPRYWSKKSKEDRVWDTIVIGSGIGGMTTAAILARTGQRVLVLEQHYVPGGFTHAFTRKGFTWDVGVHLVGGTDERTVTGRILKDLTGGNLSWAQVGEHVYDEFYFPDGFKIGFPNSPDEFRATLVDAFPGQGDVIDNYLLEVRKAAKAFSGVYMDHALPTRVGRWLGGYVSKAAVPTLQSTAKDVMESLVPDEKLRAVLLAQWGYHGSPPSEASWGLQALIVAHFLWGATYPVGGAPEIAQHMLHTVAEAGGWTRIHADVEQIVIHKGRAVGVRLTTGEELRAHAIASAAGAHNTVAKLLPPDMRDTAWVKRTAGHKAGPAHLCLYLGFHGDVAAAGGTPQSQWFYDTWDHEQGHWQVSPDEDLSRPGVLFTSYPSLKDPHHDPGADIKHTGEMITFVPWEPFEAWQDTKWRKRGGDYEAFKERMTEQMLGVLFEHHPQMRDMLVHHELATPLSTDFFCKPYKGSIYGYAVTPERYSDPWLRCDSPIKGLYLSGCDIGAPGVMGAMMGGVICAIAMQPVRTMRWLAPIARRR